MAQVDELEKALRSQGFKADTKLRDQLDRDAGEHPQYEEPSADARSAGLPARMVAPGTNLRSTGAYEVLGAFRKGEAVVVVEQNTSPNPLEPRPEYRQVPITQAPVAVVTGPNGFRVACDPTDTDLVAAEAAAASGDFSLHERRNAEHALRVAGFDQDPGNPGQWVRNGLRFGVLTLLMLPGMLLGRLLGVLWLVSPRVVTNATKKAWLDAWYSAAALGAPATHYFGLSTSAPNEDGTGITETAIGTAAYARVARTAGTALFPLSTAANTTVKTNAGGAITWPAATGSWGTVSHCFQANHATTAAGATVTTDWQALGSPQAIGSGTTASIADGSWQSTLD